LVDCEKTIFPFVKVNRGGCIVKEKLQKTLNELTNMWLDICIDKQIDIDKKTSMLRELLTLIAIVDNSIDELEEDE
jgi:hypothetical protein